MADAVASARSGRRFRYAMGLLYITLSDISLSLVLDGLMRLVKDEDYPRIVDGFRDLAQKVTEDHSFLPQIASVSIGESKKYVVAQVINGFELVSKSDKLHVLPKVQTLGNMTQERDRTLATWKTLSTFLGRGPNPDRESLQTLRDSVNSFEPKTTPLTCYECSDPGAYYCGGCMFATYCSRECQRKGWKAHKTDCKQFVGGVYL
jgi:hypothetical protein